MTTDPTRTPGELSDAELAPLPSVPFARVGDCMGPCAAMAGETEDAPLFTASQVREAQRAALAARPVRAQALGWVLATKVGALVEWDRTIHRIGPEGASSAHHLRVADTVHPEDAPHRWLAVGAAAETGEQPAVVRTGDAQGDDAMGGTYRLVTRAGEQPAAPTVQAAAQHLIDVIDGRRDPDAADAVASLRAALTADMVAPTKGRA